MKDSVVNFRTTKAISESIRKMAECEGVTVSEFLLDLVTEKQMEYKAVELFAMNPEKGEKASTIGTFYFKDSRTEAGDRIIKLANDEVGAPAVICTKETMLEMIPFSDTMVMKERE